MRGKCGAHAALGGFMGEDDQVGLALAFLRFVLEHRIDRDVALGEDAGDFRKHAFFVGHAQAQVKRGDRFLHRQHRRGVQFVRLECEMRHAVAGVGGVQARDVHQVGNHRGGGRLAARALAIIKRGAHGIGLHQHGVHRALDAGDEAFGGHQRRVDAQFDALRPAARDA